MNKLLIVGLLILIQGGAVAQAFQGEVQGIPGAPGLPAVAPPPFVPSQVPHPDGGSQHPGLPSLPQVAPSRPAAN